MAERMRSDISSEHKLSNLKISRNKNATTYSNGSINAITAHSWKFTAITNTCSLVFVGQKRVV